MLACLLRAFQNQVYNYHTQRATNSDFLVVWYNLGTTSLHPALNAGQGFLMEFIVTSLLLFVVLSSAADR